MNEIKAIIFDLGKVVFDLSFERVLLSWSQSSGKSVEAIKNDFEFDTIQKHQFANA